MSGNGPTLERSYTLNFNGDWGQANFHRICSWLTQEFCDRAGSRSQVAIWSNRDGGLEAFHRLQDGETDLIIGTPTMMVGDALEGKGLFSGRALPNVRALATIPQNDRMVLAIAPEFEISSFQELREKKPKLKIATSTDDGTNFIGRVATHFLEAHGLDKGTLEAWGCEFDYDHRPEQALFKMQDGKVDAVLQEAIMTPWWRDVIETEKAIPLSAETDAVEKMVANHGYRHNSLPAGFWDNIDREIHAVDFSDFAIVVRDDMPEDIAHLLTWCLVETRAVIEGQYRHIPSERSPINWPLEPKKMALTPLPLHAGAERYYREAGYL